MGLPGLSPKDRHRVALGNRQARWLVDIIRVCRRLCVPIVVENPASSRLWLYLGRLLGKPSSDTVFNHCRYGASFSKPTRLWSWNVDLSALGLRCSVKVCVASGKPHVTLSGSDGRAFRTSCGAENPPAFCGSAARICLPDVLVMSALSRHPHAGALRSPAEPHRPPIKYQFWASGGILINNFFSRRPAAPSR